MRYGVFALVCAVALVAVPVGLQADDKTAEPDRTVTVEATDFAFSPETIEVEASTTLKVKLVNKGNVSHSWAVPELGAETKQIQPGKTTTVTLSPEEPGEYKIKCEVSGHEQVGMVGTLKVTS